MSRYWCINVTGPHFYPPVQVLGVLATEARLDDDPPEILQFVEAATLFDFPEAKTTGIGFDKLYLFIGDLPVARLVERESEGRKYWLIPVEGRS